MELILSNRQRAHRVDAVHLRCLAINVLPNCLEHHGAGEASLPQLDAVEISLVSDRKISELHLRFMGVPGATDVITFAHGEIVISAETAARQAEEFKQDFHQELFRYIVHGLLHLNGHEDAVEPAAATMWQAQEDLVSKYWQAPDGTRRPGARKRGVPPRL